MLTATVLIDERVCGNPNTPAPGSQACQRRPGIGKPRHACTSEAAVVKRTRKPCWHAASPSDTAMCVFLHRESLKQPQHLHILAPPTLSQPGFHLSAQLGKLFRQLQA
jgi:hypothetical protein